MKSSMNKYILESFYGIAHSTKPLTNGQSKRKEKYSTSQYVLKNYTVLSDRHNTTTMSSRAARAQNDRVWDTKL